MSDLFVQQKERCRTKLPHLQILGDVYPRYKAVVARVILTDPQIFYDRIRYTANAFKRHQAFQNVNREVLFPIPVTGTCACGCGKQLVGRRRRWATEECSLYAYFIYSILCGNRDVIDICLKAYYGEGCMECGDLPEDKILKSGAHRTSIEIDHTVPVHKGGGCCWLSNYKQLCCACHKKKTRKDMSRASWYDQ